MSLLTENKAVKIIIGALNDKELYLGIHQGPIKIIVGFILTSAFSLLAFYNYYAGNSLDVVFDVVMAVFCAIGFYYGIDYYQLIVPFAHPKNLYKIGDTYFAGSSISEAELFAETHNISGDIEEVSNNLWAFNNNIIE